MSEQYPVHLYHAKSRCPKPLAMHFSTKSLPSQTSRRPSTRTSSSHPQTLADSCTLAVRETLNQGGSGGSSRGLGLGSLVVHGFGASG